MCASIEFRFKTIPIIGDMHLFKEQFFESFPDFVKDYGKITGFWMGPIVSVMTPQESISSANMAILFFLRMDPWHVIDIVCASLAP